MAPRRGCATEGLRATASRTESRATPASVPLVWGSIPTHDESEQVVVNASVLTSEERGDMFSGHTESRAEWCDLRAGNMSARC